MECNQTVTNEINTKANRNLLFSLFFGVGTKQLLHWLWSGFLFSLMPIIILFTISYVAYGHVDILENASDVMISVVSVGATVLVGIFDYTEAYKKNATFLMVSSIISVVLGSVVYAISVVKLTSGSGVPQRVVYFALVILAINIILEIIIAMTVNYKTNKDGGKQNG